MKNFGGDLFDNKKRFLSLKKEEALIKQRESIRKFRADAKAVSNKKSKNKAESINRIAEAIAQDKATRLKIDLMQDES